MSGFDAGSLSSLDYDLTGFPRQDGQGQCTGKGVVPEPSIEALETFQAAMEQLEKEAETLDGPAAYQRTLDAVAGLTGGSPSREELAALPPRALAAFSRWLFGEFTDPKA